MNDVRLPPPAPVSFFGSVTFVRQRTLTGHEERRVRYEFMSQVRLYRRLRLVKPLLLAAVVSVIGIPAWLASNTLLGATTIVLAVIATGVAGARLLQDRRLPSEFATPLAITLNTMCAFQRDKLRVMMRCVGPYPVALRQGWERFWPEGQVADVELCFLPPELAFTQGEAVLLALPQISLPKWLAIPPPPDPGLLMFWRQPAHQRRMDAWESRFRYTPNPT
jgi:hypothetical protein